MNTQGKHFWIGIFVLASLSLFAGLVAMFGNFQTFLKRQVYYSVRFDDAPGVGPGTPVRKLGVRIGEVKSVQLEEEKGQVVVDLGVDEPHRIRNSDQLIVTHNLLGGDTSIDIERKEGEVPEPMAAVNPDIELKGQVQVSVAQFDQQSAQDRR